ncbi:ABC transporter ATP-binding protein [Thalassobius sp. MITS945101]|uniref:ABC transporter ATP-binding protein n=1 Tax=Thalassobius sp. MITS945101 TaxID=3096994 RepID=UPI00399B8B1C
MPRNATPTEIALQIQNLAVDVGKSTFVQGATLTVPKGEIHGLLGPNGAGKTTLLRKLYRAARASAEIIQAFGRPIDDHSSLEWAKLVGALVQSSGLLAGLTPQDIVEIGLSILELDRSEIADRRDEALSLVGLSDKANQPAGNLSGGELQRCYFAQLLACDPEIYILDEPTNHLDLHYQLALLDEVQRRGRTVLMTLHDLSLAKRYCDQVYLMSAGQIVDRGTPDQVLTGEALMQYYQVDGQFQGAALSLVGPVQAQASGKHYARR